VLRQTDATHYLLVRYGSNLTVTEVNGATTITHVSIAAPTATPGSRHRLEARLQGDRIRVYWDGVFKAEAKTTFQQTVTRHGLAWNPSADIATALDTFDLRAATVVITGPNDLLSREASSVGAAIAATHAQGATLTYSATGLPPGLAVASASGAITGDLSHDAAGVYAATVRAEGAGAFAERTLTWRVMCPESDYTVSPPVVDAPGSGNDTYTILVDSHPGCPWTSTINADFIQPASDGNGDGDGGFQVTVMNNPSPLPRVGRVTVAAQDVLIVQQNETNAGCTVTPSAPNGFSFNADGGSETMSVTASETCQWLAVRSGSWITLGGGANGVGNGQVTVSVNRNYTGQMRQGYVAINGAVLTVQQTPDQCYGTYSLKPESHTVTLNAVNQTFHIEVDTIPGCSWEAVSHTNWLHVTEISPPNGVGPGFARIYAENNHLLTTRDGYLVVAGMTVIVTQCGAGCTGPMDDEVTYYVTDAIGSVRMTVGPTGQATEFDYLPFGQTRPTENTNERIQFAGKERDHETAGATGAPQDYFGARYYDDRSARFTSSDPVTDAVRAVSNPQRWNRYTYVLNNPLRYVDPDGRQTRDEQAVQGAVYGAGASLSWDAFIRSLYNRAKAALPRTEGGIAARDALRSHYQGLSSPFGEALAKFMQSSRDSKAGKSAAQLAASVSRGNPRADAFAKGATFAGPALIGIGAATSTIAIVNAPEGSRGKVAAQEVGAFGGALGGAWLGGKIGFFAGSFFPGPGSLIGAGAGTLLGGATGAMAGRDVANAVADD
jgi:RHS repeat-associated protein